MDIQTEIQSFPIQISIPVQWGDMDAANHVNNVRYLRWAESSRISFFQKFDIGLAFQNGIAPILAWQDCKYIFPLSYPDTAIVTCGVSSMEEHQFFLESRVYSTVHNRIAAICQQRIMAYDYAQLAKTNIPQTWVEGLNRSQS